MNIKFCDFIRYKEIQAYSNIIVYGVIFTCSNNDTIMFGSYMDIFFTSTHHLCRRVS